MNTNRLGLVNMAMAVALIVGIVLAVRYVVRTRRIAEAAAADLAALKHGESAGGRSA